MYTFITVFAIVLVSLFYTNIGPSRKVIRVVLLYLMCHFCSYLDFSLYL